MKSGKRLGERLRGVLRFPLAAIAGLIAAMAVGAPAPQYWQVVLNYDANGVVLQDATEIAPTTKQVVTPGLAGAPALLNYDALWLDGNNAILAQTKTELPLGQILALQAGSACARHIPAEGTLVIRLEGPASGARPKSLALRRTGAKRLTAGAAAELPPAFKGDALALGIKHITAAGALPPPGPKTVTKIRDTGPDSNRLVMVVMGDGYTAANLSSGKFTTNVDDLVLAFQGKSLWTDYFEAVNVYRVDVESNQEGADRSESSTSPIVDTYFNSTFWSFDIDRLLTINSQGMNRAIAAADSKVGAGVWDAIFILVNSTVYGGSGGSISVSSIHPDASEVIIHEFGHTFAGLADEYSDPYPGYPPGDSEPNVDFDGSGSGLKWLAWVEPGTQLPTPETPETSDIVGAFEGARYLPTGIYRPKQFCLMKYLGFDFCPVCKEANIQSFFDIVQYADSVTPAANASVTVPGGGSTFIVNPIPVSTLTYAWTLGGTPIDGAAEPLLTIQPESLTQSFQELRVVISNPTPLVRIQPLTTKSYTWMVKAASGIPSPTPSPAPSASPTETPIETPSPSPTPVVSSASILRYLLGFPDTPTAPDLNGDGVVDAADLLVAQ